MTEPLLPRALVVDDDPSMRRFLDTLLTHRGWRTVGAGSGAEAMERLAGDDGAFDIALLDAMLPDVRGYDLARRLVSEERTAGLPLCFLSGALSGRALPTEAVGCILKPALPAQVLSTIQAVVDSPRSTAAARLAAIDAIERLSFL